MMKSNFLAIIIPLYKKEYLIETLSSISRQSCKDFTVYIGNDGIIDSQIDNIIDEYKKYINIEYTFFNENLGQTSLIKQWHRCISLSKNEKWLWLFSDDDLMDYDCVENFKNNISIYYQLYRFNSIKFIENEKIKYQISNNMLPRYTTLNDFLKIKFLYKCETYVTDFIFNRSIYNQIGGFPDFPLGWCSDDAFWILGTKLSNIIITIDKSRVYWRYSNLNISSLPETSASASKKLKACIKFFKLLYKEKINCINYENKKYFIHWISKQFEYRKNKLNIVTRYIYYINILFIKLNIGSVVYFIYIRNKIKYYFK